MNISIEDQLGLISFEVDKEKHIKVETSICRQCVDKPCLKFCPSKRFTLEKGEIVHNYEGCLECGSCKFACPKGAVDRVKRSRPIKNLFQIHRIKLSGVSSINLGV